MRNTMHRVALFGVVLLAVVLLSVIPLRAGFGQAAETAPAPASAPPPNESAVLHLAGVYPLPQDQFWGRLVLYFDQPLAASQPEDAVVFSPPLAGQVAIAENYVSFIASEPVQPLTVYTASISPGIQSASGEAVATPISPLTFATYILAVDEFRAWEAEDGRNTLSLRFNARVPEQEFRGHFAMMDAAGNILTPEVTVVAPNLFRATMPPNTDLPVFAFVSAGLRDENGVALAGDFSARYPAEAPLAVESASWSRGEYGQDTIQLTLSAAVESGPLQAKTKVIVSETGDEIPVEVVAPGAVTNPELRFNAPEAEALTLSIQAGLLASGMEMLPSPYEVTLEPQFSPLQVVNQYWEYRGIDGPVLHLSFNQTVTVEALKEHLIFEPAPEGMRLEAGDYQEVNVLADWKTGVTYTAVLSAGLSDESNRVRLEEDLRVSLEETPEVSGLAFGYESKYYFPRRTAGPLPLKSRNVENADVTLHRLFPSNLIPALEYVENGYTHEGFNENFAQSLGTTSVEFPKQKDGVITKGLDLKEILPTDQKGIFALSLSPSYDWRSVKIVVWTDIGILAHWQDDQVVVFAHNLFTLEPMPLARVRVVSSKNQVMGEANTDARGLAILPALDASLGRPRAVVVELDNDFSYLDLRDRQQDETPFTATMPPFDKEGYDAFVYADRDLYRPGETVHLRWVVRTNYGDAVAGVPFLLEVKNPKNVVVHSAIMKVSELGTAGLDFATETDYLTGPYRIELRVPEASNSIGALTVNLEEFVPNRMRAGVQIPEGPWVAGNAYPVTVLAEHLFGGPASDRKASAEVVLRPAEDPLPEWSEYHFGNDEAYTPEAVSLGDAQTDASGQAVFTYTPASEAPFPLQATIRGTILELGGRPVTARQEVVLFPASVALGVAVSLYEGDQGVKVSVAAVQPDGLPAPLTRATVTLEKESWNYYVRRYEGSNEARWDRAYATLSTQDVTLVDGRGATVFPLADGYGQYRVRVSADDTEQYSTLSFSKYWDSIEVSDTAEPSLVKVTLGKEEYQVGDEVTLHIQAPFDGQAVVVLQGDQYQEVLPTAVVNGTAEARFIAGPAHHPNVWAEVTVINKPKAKDGSTPVVYPFSGFDIVNIPIHDPSRELEVALAGLPEEVRPQQDITVGVEVKDVGGAPVEAEVTLAAVDEGIHNILGYADPDPAAWFERTRQPQYQRAHYYDHVAYDFEPTPMGGDMLQKRLGKDSPNIGENWIKPVALWSGVVKTAADGKAQVTFQLPEFNGELRLVAVAITKRASGAASARLKVRRPYMLQTSVPRFLLPGDSFTATAVVYNTTDAEMKARVSWTPSGTIIAGAGSQEVTVGPRAEASVRADITAGQDLGQGAIQWRLEALDGTGAVVETVEQHLPLPVREPAGYESQVEQVVVGPGETRSFTNTLFLDDARFEAKIVASANPMLRLKKAFEFLIGYPYGCLEQTTSRSMPLYLLRKHATLFANTRAEATQYDGWVQAGVNRLFSMQLPGGSLTFWPGGQEPYPYGSVYALHFLTLLHRDHAPGVPEEPYRALQGYVRTITNDLGDGSPSDYYLRAYALYVLALDGDLEAIEDISRFDSVQLPVAGRYLLAASLALQTQDPARVEQYLATAPSMDYDTKELDGTLNSDIRNTAVRLLGLVQMQARPEEQHAAVEKLLQYIETAQYPNTQEMAFTVTALGLYLENIGADLAGASALIQGPAGDKALTGNAVFKQEHNQSDGVYTVQNDGTLPVYVQFMTAGVPKAPKIGAEAAGIVLERSYRDEQGAAVDTGVFEQGQTYVAMLRLTVDAALENVIVADLLPAGLEIENPRLDPDVLAGQELEDAVTPEYLEIRDDRLVVSFGELAAGEHNFYYLVRAVTPGAYQHPSAHAECMYEPSIYGDTGAGMAKVN